MTMFDTARKGYDKKQVDEYIFSAGSRADKTIAGLRARVEELEKTNAELEDKLQACRAREDSVAKALIGAIDKAKEIEYASKVRYAIEGERLKEFESKWTAYCKDRINKVAPKQREETLAFVKAMKKSLDEVMSAQLHLGNYVNEAVIEHENEERRLANATDAAAS